MKIAYVTTYNATDIKNWSGIGYYMAKSLKEQSILLKYVGPLKEKYSLLFKGKQYLHNHLFNKRYLRDREPLILKNYAEQVYRKLAGLNIDIVFSPGTIPIAYLECDYPIVFGQMLHLKE